MVIPIIKTIGKHKVPRFIYHLTNKSNWESIKFDGVIKTSFDNMMGQGVFTAELTNLFKHWRINKSWGNKSLQESLVNFVSKGSDEIVILKIPTSSLDLDKLVIRSQNRLFSWYSSSKYDEAKNIISKMKDKEFGNKFPEVLTDVITKLESKSLAYHLTKGDSCKLSALFKQRKEALEYVYLENIPMSNVEKIGEVNIAELRKSVEYDPVRPMRSLFTNLLKGAPEVKGAELLTC